MRNIFLVLLSAVFLFVGCSENPTYDLALNKKEYKLEFSRRDSTAYNVTDVYKYLGKIENVKYVRYSTDLHSANIVPDTNYVGTFLERSELTVNKIYYLGIQIKEIWFYADSIVLKDNILIDGDKNLIGNIDIWAENSYNKFYQYPESITLYY